jgi:sporulation protein YlmC with PRC-barrel domain
MNRQLILVASSLASLAFIDALFAQTGDAKQKPPLKKPAETAANEDHPVLAVRTMQQFAGMKVEDARGEQVARLEDAFIGSGGKIAFGVLAAEGGEKLLVVPWDRLQAREAHSEHADTEVATLRIDVDKARLKAAPAFDGDRWPTKSDDPLFADSERYFSAGKPSDPGAKPPAMMLLRATKIQGRAIESASGEKLGDVRSLVVDPAHGRATYLALAMTAANDPHEKLVAIPWEALGVTREGDRERLVINAAKEKLAAAPEFRNDEPSWKEMSDPIWIGRLYAHFGVRPYWSVPAKPSELEKP